MRSDEVPHHTEIQAFESKESIEIVNMAEDKEVSLGQASDWNLSGNAKT